MPGIEILRETEDWIAVYKPAGMAVQNRQAGQMDLLHYLRGKKQGEKTDPFGGQARSRGRIEAVHRLDQPVEGIVLFSKNKRAAASFAEQLRSHRMTKEYLAVVCPSERERQEGWQRLSDCLVREGRENLSRVVPAETPGAKRSELDYRWLEEAGGPEGWLHIRLYSGRRHQIRVQLANAGMSILGDRKYGPDIQGCRPAGSGESEKGADEACQKVSGPAGPRAFVPQTEGGDRRGRAERGLALCAFRLCFQDPASGEEVCLQVCPRGDSFGCHFDLNSLK